MLGFAVCVWTLETSKCVACRVSTSTDGRGSKQLELPRAAPHPPPAILDRLRQPAARPRPARARPRRPPARLPLRGRGRRAPRASPSAARGHTPRAYDYTGVAVGCTGDVRNGEPNRRDEKFSAAFGRSAKAQETRRRRAATILGCTGRTILGVECRNFVRYLSVNHPFFATDSQSTALG